MHAIARDSRREGGRSFTAQSVPTMCMILSATEVASYHAGFALILVVGDHFGGDDEVGGLMRAMREQLSTKLRASGIARPPC